MTMLVDTSVWSLAFRRDAPAVAAEVDVLKRSLEAGEAIFTTGLILQELLQGFGGPRDRAQIVDRFSALPMISPERQDHVEAASLRNQCRRAGIQVGTIDAILAQICIRHELTMLTTDHDFLGIAQHSSLRVWKPSR